MRHEKIYKSLTITFGINSILCIVYYIIRYGMQTDHTNHDLFKMMILAAICAIIAMISDSFAKACANRRESKRITKRLAEQKEELAVLNGRAKWYTINVR